MGEWKREREREREERERESLRFCCEGREGRGFRVLLWRERGEGAGLWERGEVYMAGKEGEAER